MIRLDNRTGSKELEIYFKPYGVSVQVCRMEFGDIAWEGKGPQGIASIGVERKQIDDLIQSIQSKRLSGFQLPGLLDTYDYVYLLVEGIWRPGANGELEVQGYGRGAGGREWHARSIPYRAVHNYISTLELQCGLITRRTNTTRESVHVLVDLYRYWTEKDWGEHRAHSAIYTGKEAGRAMNSNRRGALVPRRAKLSEMIASQLPGIARKAGDVAAHFKFNSVDMVNASEKQLASVPGIGAKGAEKIWHALRRPD